MQDKKVNINVSQNEAGDPIKVELVERSGQAETIKDNVVVISADVTPASINDYINKKEYEEEPKTNKGLITYCSDIKSPFIRFNENPLHDEATTLTATLQPNEDLAKWGINNDTKFNAKTLKNLIRSTAHLFPDVSIASSWIKQLDTYDAKVTTELNKEDDRRGNTKDSVKTTLEFTKGSLPGNVVLKTPLYKGTPKKEITCEIEVDVVQNTPMYSFYCMDLRVAEEQAINDCIEVVLKEQSKKFIVIQQP